MSERKQVSEPVPVEVSTRQERERQERFGRKSIERDDEIDWRSYDRRRIPRRWRA